MTCQDRDIRKIEEETEDQKEIKEKIRNMRLHKYLGETHRSMYERGWEHMNDMARMGSESHMLKHLVSNHENEDFSQVRFGMKAVQYCSTSFSRQIKEVTILKEKSRHDILN